MTEFEASIWGALPETFQNERFVMERQAITYETLQKITDAVTSAMELDDVYEHVVHSLTRALQVKGCSLMLLDRNTNELKLVTAVGLSREYLEKGPISASRSIAESLSDGPAVISNVEDDPRLQYPQEAVREGIQSILSFPMTLRGKSLGVLRLYSADAWEVNMQDIAIIQAITLIVALCLDNLRVQAGFRSSLDVLKVIHRSVRPMERTLYE